MAACASSRASLGLAVPCGEPGRQAAWYGPEDGPSGSPNRSRHARKFRCYLACWRYGLP